MREESQIEDMRAAVRGDRERAEQARQRSYENVRVLTEPPPAEEAPEPTPHVEDPPSRGLRGLFRRR